MPAAATQAAEASSRSLTPVVKGFLTDKGFECAVQAQQMLGGHGYIEETGVSQFVRDARIAMIYEGANGVQALDLVGRKLGQDGGKPIMAFFDLVRGLHQGERGRRAAEGRLPRPAQGRVEGPAGGGEYFLQNMKTPNAALAGSTDFLHLFGHVCLGYMWARMARRPQSTAATTSTARSSPPAATTWRACCRRPRSTSPASSPAPSR